MFFCNEMKKNYFYFNVWAFMARDEKHLRFFKFEKKKLQIHAGPRSVIRILVSGLHKMNR
jgi:hypothetical protein